MLSKSRGNCSGVFYEPEEGTLTGVFLILNLGLLNSSVISESACRNPGYNLNFEMDVYSILNDIAECGNVSSQHIQQLVACMGAEPTTFTL